MAVCSRIAGREAPLSGLKRIPHLSKPQPLEVFHIRRREFGHALRGHGEGGAGVVDFAEGEVLGAGAFPKRVVQRAAFRREADEPPAGMRAVGLDDFDGFVGGEWLLENGGIAEKTVEFGENEFGNGHVIVAVHRLQPVPSVIVPWRGVVECVKQDIGVNGEHRAIFWRVG